MGWGEALQRGTVIVKCEQCGGCHDLRDLRRHYNPDGAPLSARDRKPMRITYYVAISFVLDDLGSVVAGDAFECPNAGSAIMFSEARGEDRRRCWLSRL